jgi:hypothetical protein
MSSGLLVVVAISTAAAVIFLSLLVSKLVHTVVDSGSGLTPDASRLRGLVGRRSGGARARVRPVSEGAARVPRVESTKEGAVAVKQPVVPAGGASLGPGTQKPQPAIAVAPHVPAGRRVDVKEFVLARSDQGDGRAEDDSTPYRQVGEKVTAVLTAAEQAAVQIRETALKEAEEIRRAAEEQAATTREAAQARHAEADGYRKDMTAAADAYAEETRRRTDEEAARTVSQAEEQARLVRAEAEQKASEIEAEAIRRRDALKTSTEGMQERIHSMLSAFGRASSELEELLPAEPRSGAQEHEHRDEALKQGPPDSDLSTHPDR